MNILKTFKNIKSKQRFHKVAIFIPVFICACGIYKPLARGNSESYPHSTTQPDNSGRNIRDANGSTLTPEDQTNKQSDVNMTQNIRKAIVSDGSLSTNAKNIKIVTVNQIVTLRGPVDSEQEKNIIDSKARQIAGTSNVQNQLEVIKKH
jgi:hyperosmotically inducible protein